MHYLLKVYIGRNKGGIKEGKSETAYGLFYITDGRIAQPTIKSKNRNLEGLFGTPEELGEKLLFFLETIASSMFLMQQK